ncbi:CAP domain-containing protein [Hydrogenovibrio sp. JE_KL2]|uniref:CAP domain-containing protein n=1 Tax=Hydrogenovibrio sp. JE_KL2 TaxID=2651188 RepID=UPI00128D8979|nr:CAP domain-containing protein [Hydrogenovibrio sp. JE_KL2]MPQ76412.1 CAP domain-containing protein [Hydrogenovibrio sp. JE_KL2]
MRLLKLLILILALLFLMYQLFLLVLTPPEFLRQTGKIEQAPKEVVAPQHKALPSERIAQNALHYINQLRHQLGLNPLQSNEKLDKAALNHSRYCVVNNLQQHVQTPNLADFTGKTPSDRAYAVGYPAGVNEVISFNRDSAKPFVDDLMSAIYHRLGLLDMTIDQIGTGVYRVDGKKPGAHSVASAFTAETSNLKLAELCQNPIDPRPGELAYKGICRGNVMIPKQAFDRARYNIAHRNPKWIVWPQDGSTVPPVFYEEMPDPLPECDASGYPVHIQINPIYWGRITFVNGSFKLYRVEGQQKTPVVIERTMTNLNDPNHENRGKKPEWYALFPRLRLDWNAEYLAEVQTREAGQITTHHWRFYTPKLSHLTRFRSSQGNHTPLPIKIGEIHHIYFEPHACQAPRESQLKTRTPSYAQIKTRFIDGQTLQIQVIKARKGDKIVLDYVPTHTRITFQVN